MKASLYTAYHKFSTLIDSASIRPIHVGRAKAGKPLLGMIGDDTGDNISTKNGRYCELTALYWAWKNDGDSSHIGLMHYRRLLDFDGTFAGEAAEQKPATLRTADYAAAAERWLAAHGDVDLVVPKLHRMSLSMRDNYRTRHRPEDLDVVDAIIRDHHPAYLAHYNAVMSECDVRLANMFLARREIVDEYCAFVFDVLGRLDAADVARDHYNAYQSRYLGFISERLFTVFVRKYMAEHPQARVHEVNILNLSETLVFPYCADDSFNGAEQVNIAFSSDNAYLPHAAAMVASVLDHANADRHYNFFYLYSEIEAHRLEVFASIFRPYRNATLHAINVGNPFEDSYRSASRAPSNATYNRFLLFELLPTLKRLLYIDSDMIVTGDVAEIFDVPMGDAKIAGVTDHIMTRTLTVKVGTVDPAVPDLYAYQRDELGLSDAQINNYFNAGLLVFNFAAMDVVATGAELMKRVETSRFLFRDQDLLNSYFKDSLYRLPAKYNVFNSRASAYTNVPQGNFAEAMAAKRAPFVVHYAAKSYKPWEVVEVDFGHLYWQALMKTPFYVSVLSGALGGPGSVLDPDMRLPLLSRAGLTARGRRLADKYPSLRPFLQRIYRAIFFRRRK
jgi:lipopolysaccharide biosynthesis glycosyltransferase